MSTIETILVIMLAVGFFILLVLSIVIASLVIIIVRRLNRISQKAETATANLSNAAAMVSSKLAPVAASTLFGLIAKKLKSRK